MTNDEWMIKVAASPLCYGAASACGFDSSGLELLWSLGLGIWSFCAIATFLTRKDRF
jgi:hypothetical protein